MADRYDCFAALAASETPNVHYRIGLADRGTPVVILAPHGGSIEPGSSEIALAIARSDYSFYAFEGLRPDGTHGDLHIASSLFDEPQALKLVAAAETAIAIHGRRDRSDRHTVWMGGADIALRNAIAASLQAFGFPAAVDGHSLPGRMPTNICNRGSRRAGVQLELPGTLRDRLVRDETALDRFADAVRAVLTTR
jgi:phage replication-related protein YjqB (UPF0714/DUF867 family)